MNEIPIEDIFEAYYSCRKHKRNTEGALQFEVDLEKNLVDLWRDINGGVWVPGKSTAFIVDKPVKREIFAAPFRDRVIHHLVISKINYLFEKTFIYDSYSCRAGKGTHFGIRRVHRFMRRCRRNGEVTAWALKLDIRGFFMHIDRNILHKKLSEFIDARYHAADKEKVKELCALIIANDPTKGFIPHSGPEAWRGLPADKSLFTAEKGCGIPIGNLTSQIFANFYLSEFDHFIKKQCRYYGRYVDDCVIVHHSRAFLKRLIVKIRDYLAENLRLQLNPKKIYLQPCTKGVKFLGCFIKPSHIVAGRRTVKNFILSVKKYNALALDHKPEKEEVDKYIASVNSYLGIMNHYKTYRKRRAILRGAVSRLWDKHTFTVASLRKIQRRK
jgi:retron-type reverse transcriptase